MLIFLWVNWNIQFFPLPPLKPSYNKHYIDDIFILWLHTITELDKFNTSLNNYHPSIKFTSEFNHNKIASLDVNIYKGPNFEFTKRLEVETYIKPTNCQLYVHANSYHPPVKVWQLER